MEPGISNDVAVHKHRAWHYAADAESVVLTLIGVMRCNSGATARAAPEATCCRICCRIASMGDTCALAAAF